MYLQNNSLIKVTEMIKKLNQEIVLEEIEEVIGELKLGKSPGTDGITSKFYKIV